MKPDHRLERILNPRDARSAKKVEVRVVKTMLYGGDAIYPGPRVFEMEEREAEKRMARGEVELVLAEAPPAAAAPAAVAQAPEPAPAEPAPEPVVATPAPAAGKPRAPKQGGKAKP